MDRSGGQSNAKLHIEGLRKAGLPSGPSASPRSYSGAGCVAYSRLMGTGDVAVLAQKAHRRDCLNCPNVSQINKAKPSSVTSIKDRGCGVEALPGKATTEDGYTAPNLSRRANLPDHQLSFVLCFDQNGQETGKCLSP